MIYLFVGVDFLKFTVYAIPAPGSLVWRFQGNVAQLTVRFQSLKISYSKSTRCTKAQSCEDRNHEYVPIASLGKSRDFGRGLMVFRCWRGGKLKICQLCVVWRNLGSNASRIVCSTAQWARERRTQVRIFQIHHIPDERSFFSLIFNWHLAGAEIHHPVHNLTVLTHTPLLWSVLE